MYFGKVKGTENDWGFDGFETTFENYIEIPDEEHRKIIEEANAKGKLVIGDKDGKPILIDPPDPTREELDRDRLQHLLSYLESTDWYAIRYYDEGKEIPAEIKQKRHEAREEISELRLRIEDYSL